MRRKIERGQKRETRKYEEVVGDTGSISYHSLRKDLNALSKKQHIKHKDNCDSFRTK